MCFSGSRRRASSMDSLMSKDYYLPGSAKELLGFVVKSSPRCEINHRRKDRNREHAHPHHPPSGSKRPAAIPDRASERRQNHCSGRYCFARQYPCSRFAQQQFDRRIALVSRRVSRLSLSAGHGSGFACAGRAARMGRAGVHRFVRRGAGPGFLPRRRTRRAGAARFAHRQQPSRRAGLAVGGIGRSATGGGAGASLPDRTPVGSRPRSAAAARRFAPR